MALHIYSIENYVARNVFLSEAKCATWAAIEGRRQCGGRETCLCFLREAGEKLCRRKGLRPATEMYAGGFMVLSGTSCESAEM